MDQFCRFLNNFDSFWTILIVSNIFCKNLLQYESILQKLQKCHISSVFRICSEDFWLLCSQLNKNMHVGIPTVMNHFWMYLKQTCHSGLLLITGLSDSLRPASGTLWHLCHGSLLAPEKLQHLGHGSLRLAPGSARPTRSPGAHSHYYAYYTLRYHSDPFLRGLSR